MKMVLGLLLSSIFLLAACAIGPATRPEQRAKATAPSDQRTPWIVRHFWFDYGYPPEPGRRVWIQVASDTWVELYPSGHQSHYKLEGRTRVGQSIGSVLSKVAGDPAINGTLNDGSFQAFIPDKGSGWMAIYVRYFENGNWSVWQPLAMINLIE